MLYRDSCPQYGHVHFRGIKCSLFLMAMSSKSDVLSIVFKPVVCFKSDPNLTSQQDFFCVLAFKSPHFCRSSTWMVGTKLLISTFFLRFASQGHSRSHNISSFFKRIFRGSSINHVVAIFGIFDAPSHLHGPFYYVRLML